jgi:hypothetical protein
VRLQNISLCIQKYHQGIFGANTSPSSGAKKFQQAFLAPLPGKALVKRIF